MKSIKKSEPKIIIVISSVEETQSPKKPKINPWILKVISVIIVTLISWLAPEAAIALFLTRLLLIFLQWRNQV